MGAGRDANCGDVPGDFGARACGAVRHERAEPLQSKRRLTPAVLLVGVFLKKRAMSREKRGIPLRARPERGEWGLIGRAGSASRRVLKPDLEVPCGPRLLGGNIAASAFVTKQT